MATAIVTGASRGTGSGVGRRPGRRRMVCHRRRPERRPAVRDGGDPPLQYDRRPAGHCGRRRDGPGAPTTASCRGPGHGRTGSRGEQCQHPRAFPLTPSRLRVPALAAPGLRRERRRPPALLQEAMATLAASPDPRVVNVTSDAAVEAYEGWGAYGPPRRHSTISARRWPRRTGACGCGIDPGDMDADAPGRLSRGRHLRPT